MPITPPAALPARPVTSALARAAAGAAGGAPPGPPVGPPVSGTGGPGVGPQPGVLRLWSRVWRYGLALGVGLLLWFAVVADLVPDGAEPVTDRAGAILVIDLLVGLLALVLLPLRRLHPVLTAALTAALTSVSATAIGAAAFAAVSMSTRRRWPGVVVVAAVWAASTVVYEVLYRAWAPVTREDEVWLGVAASLLAFVAYGACVATGFYIGARRELVVRLRERAVTAEREQALQAESAREAERTRIAREMHDVLAHRISLVAMHAGALAYREDLTREQTAETATVIRDNAHLALTELRGVLGVLRAAPGGAPADLTGVGEAEPPQPTLAELPALLADAAEAGTRVHLDVSGLPGGDRAALAALSPTVSRAALRVVQEALTNARKHAPGSAVRLRLSGDPATRLDLEVRNAVVPRPAGTPPGAGVGLVGLTERAALAGGHLEHGTSAGDFVVRAWLPWR